jgi:hypothetical protein
MSHDDRGRELSHGWLHFLGRPAAQHNMDVRREPKCECLGAFSGRRLISDSPLPVHLMNE